MSEWWSYSLQDLLLFSPRAYYRLFELHNRALWPAHVAALALGGAVVALLLGGWRWRRQAVAAILAACWLWVAWAFLLGRYDAINWAAKWFAAAFAVQAAALLLAGFSGIRFEARAAGLAILLFALLAQPLVGPLLGRDWAQVEVFGIAPDPTVAATLGVLAAAQGRAAWALMVIPLLWCAISGATLWAMGAPDALLLPAVGLLAVACQGRGARLKSPRMAGRRLR